MASKWRIHKSSGEVAELDVDSVNLKRGYDYAAMWSSDEPEIISFHFYEWENNDTEEAEFIEDELAWQLN